MDLRKCIVLGASGYLGLHLANYLHSKGVLVDCYDYNVKDTLTSIACNAIDVNDADSLKKIDWNVDAVFHFAGLTGTHASFDNYIDYIKVNEIGLLNVLNAIKNSGSKPRFILPSTRLVYKGNEAPLKEDAPKEAKTIYAANKIAGELMIEAFSNMFEMDYTIFRICVPYGNKFGSSYSYGTIGFFIKQSNEIGAIRLFGDGELRRTFTHVDDLCKQFFIVSQLDTSRNQAFNTAGETFSLKDVASLVARKYDARLEFIQWPEKDLKIESGHTVFNSEKIESIMSESLECNLVSWINELKT